MSEKKAVERHSFIGDARRAQIINAAIATLDEIGYARASLAQIARRADFSTALISYHFQDKDDLMNHTLMALLGNSTAFVLGRIKPIQSWREKLHTFIRASLEYQGTHRKEFNALLEIVFNARTPENIPYYKLDDEEEDPLLLELQQILRHGYEQGEFRRCHVPVMAKAIQGAIGEYMANPNFAAKIDTTTYSEELIHIFDQALRIE